MLNVGQHDDDDELHDFTWFLQYFSFHAIPKMRTICFTHSDKTIKISKKVCSL